MDLHYSASVEWSDEDGEFIALCPEFPGASGSGDTPDDAIAELQESLAILVQTYGDKGLDLPVPRRKEAYSGQIRLRVPKDLHLAAAAEAARQGVSLNTLFASYIAQGLGRDEAKDQVSRRLDTILGMTQAILMRAVPVADGITVNTGNSFMGIAGWSTQSADASVNHTN